MPLTLTVSLASATKSPASRVKVKSFDGGYKAIALNGINPVAENWSVETCPLRNTIANTLENTLIGLGADYINWTPPFDTVSKKYRIDGKITRGYGQGDVSSISFDLERIYLP